MLVYNDSLSIFTKSTSYGRVWSTLLSFSMKPLVLFTFFKEFKLFKIRMYIFIDNTKKSYQLVTRMQKLLVYQEEVSINCEFQKIRVLGRSGVSKFIAAWLRSSDLLKDLIIYIFHGFQTKLYCWVFIKFVVKVTVVQKFFNFIKVVRFKKIITSLPLSAGNITMSSLFFNEYMDFLCTFVTFCL